MVVVPSSAPVYTEGISRKNNGAVIQTSTLNGIQGRRPGIHLLGCPSLSLVPPKLHQNEYLRAQHDRERLTIWPKSIVFFCGVSSLGSLRNEWSGIVTLRLRSVFT